MFQKEDIKNITPNFIPRDNKPIPNISLSSTEVH